MEHQHNPLCEYEPITFEQIYYDPFLTEAYYQQEYRKYVEYIYSISVVDKMTGDIIYTPWPLGGQKFFPNQYILKAAFNKWVDANIASGFLPTREERDKMGASGREEHLRIACSRVPDDQPDWDEFVAYIGDEDRFYQDGNPDDILAPPPGLFERIFFNESSLTEYYDIVKSKYEQYLKRIDEKYKREGMIPRFMLGRPDEEGLKGYYLDWKNQRTAKGLLPTKKQLAGMTPEQLGEVKSRLLAQSANIK